MNEKFYLEDDTIYMYEHIGKDGMTATDFTQMLNIVKKRGSDVLRLRINSGGGSVYDGFAILSALRDSNLTIITYIDGVAASMASVIALSGHKVIMSDNAMLMIHNPKGGTFGEVKDFERQIKTLEKIKEIALRLYKDRTGLDEDTLSRMMDKETWMDAKEAFELGFIDEVSSNIFEMEKVPAVMTVDNVFNSYKFKKGKDMNINTLKLMGLKPTATVDDLNNAIKEMVAENKRLSEEYGKAEESKINMILTKAIEDGKITNEQKESYHVLLQKDFATTSTIINDLQGTQPVTVTSLLKAAKQNQTMTTDKTLPVDKAKWTLDDYRKHAPNELAANPQLLRKLTDEYEQMFVK